MVHIFPVEKNLKRLKLKSFWAAKPMTASINVPLLSQESSGGNGTTLQRKKSLPDVQNLVVVTNSQGSKQMTREEISVLSASRRETMRRQIEEIERYKANPLLYILNPRLRVSFIKLSAKNIVVQMHLVHFKLLSYFRTGSTVNAS